MIIQQAFAYLFDGANWAGSGGFLEQLGDHLVLTVLALLFAVVVAVPLGLVIGHTGRFRRSAVPAANILRALPTLGLLSLLVVGTNLDIWAVVVVLALLAVPPLLAGAYAGLEAVDRATIDAARAQGMTGWQVLMRVELPLGAPLLVGGLRSALVQVFATATLAFAFGYDSLGNAILSGLATANYPQMVAGSVLVTVGAIAIDASFALLQRFASPRGVSRGSGRSTTTSRGARPAIVAASTGTPVTKGE